MELNGASQFKTLALLRIMTGLLLLEHGTTKFLNFPVGPMNNASIATMSGAAGVLELAGGLLLIIGLFTRPVAFLLSGMAAVGYFYVHAPRGFFPILNGGELAIVYCFLLLFISFAGARAWSLDALFGKEDALAFFHREHASDWRHAHAHRSRH